LLQRRRVVVCVRATAFTTLNSSMSRFSSAKARPLFLATSGPLNSNPYRRLPAGVAVSENESVALKTPLLSASKASAWTFTVTVPAGGAVQSIPARCIARGLFPRGGLYLCSGNDRAIRIGARSLDALIRWLASVQGIMAWLFSGRPPWLRCYERSEFRRGRPSTSAFLPSPAAPYRRSQPLCH